LTGQPFSRIALLQKAGIDLQDNTLKFDNEFGRIFARFKKKRAKTGLFGATLSLRPRRCAPCLLAAVRRHPYNPLRWSTRKRC
jgi:hypothetical protein